MFTIRTTKLNEKKMYIAVGIMTIIVVLFLTGFKSVHYEIIIDSTPEIVWKVITDMNEYPQWNPVMELLEGEVKEGNKVKYMLTQDKDTQMEIRATVAQMTPNKLLNHKGGIPLIFRFNHTYNIEKEGEFIKVIIHEDYAGVGVIFWKTAPIEAAYERLNKALKLRVEKLTEG